MKLWSIIHPFIPRSCCTGLWRYMYLGDRCDKDGKCYPSIGTIARELKLSRSTVKRAIADLEKSGHIRKE